MVFATSGKTGRQRCKQLELVPVPIGMQKVILTSEITSRRQGAGQPDSQTVIIEYAPKESCVERKSLDSYLLTLWDEGDFRESLAEAILKDLRAVCRPHWAKVTVFYKSHDGIAVTGTAEAARADKPISSGRR